MMDNLTQTSTLPTIEHTGIDPCKSNYNFAAINSALHTKLNSLESKVERFVQSTAATRHQHVIPNRPRYRNFSYRNRSQNNNSEPQVHSSSTFPEHEDRRSAPTQLCFYHHKLGNQAYKCAPPCNRQRNTPSENFRRPRP